MSRGLCPHGAPWDDDIEDGVPRCVVCVSPDALATASVLRARIAALEAQVAALAAALRAACRCYTCYGSGTIRQFSGKRKPCDECRGTGLNQRSPGIAALDAVGQGGK